MSPAAAHLSPAKKAIFALVALGLLALIGEGAARLAEWRKPPLQRSLPLPSPEPDETRQAHARQLHIEHRQRGVPLVEDAEQGWSLPLGRTLKLGETSYRTNSLGLRGAELGPRAPGELRLLTLGDSSIYGLAVPEERVFGAVAASLLGEAWQRPVLAVNGGVPGHDSQQSLSRLKSMGAVVDPEWVVIGNLWSDIFARAKRQGLQLEEAAETTQGILRHLAAYRLTRRALSPWLTSRQVRFIRSHADIGDLQGDDPSRVLLADYLRNLEGLARQAEALDALPVFLVLPAPMDLDPAPLPATVLAFREALRQVAAAHDAPLVDGPAYFAAHGANMAFWNDQVHPSVEGHALLGMALAAALLRNPPAGRQADPHSAATGER